MMYGKKPQAVRALPISKRRYKQFIVHFRTEEINNYPQIIKKISNDLFLSTRARKVEKEANKHFMTTFMNK